MLGSWTSGCHGVAFDKQKYFFPNTRISIDEFNVSEFCFCEFCLTLHLIPLEQKDPSQKSKFCFWF